MSSPFLEVCFRRRYRASPQAVFLAFTTPELLSRWFSPSPEIRTEILQAEVREGGSYRFRFHLPDGSATVVRGRYRTVSPPLALVFSWTWEPPDPHAGIETFVSVAIREIDGHSQVEVRHQRFPDEESRSRHEDGWAGTLDRLAPVVESLDGP